MAGTEQSIDVELGVLHQGFERSRNHFLGRKNTKIIDIFMVGGQDRCRNPWRGRFKSNAKKNHCIIGVITGQFQSVHRGIDHLNQGASGGGIGQGAVASRHSEKVAEDGHPNSGNFGHGDEGVHMGGGGDADRTAWS